MIVLLNCNFFFIKAQTFNKVQYFTTQSRELIHNKMIATSDGGFLLVGGHLEFDVNHNVYQQGLIIKTDAQANIQWTKSINFTSSITTSSYIECRDVIQLPNGSYILCGSISEKIPISNVKGFILQLSSNGLIIEKQMTIENNTIYKYCYLRKLLSIPNDQNNFIVMGEYEDRTNDPTNFSTGLFMKVNINDFSISTSKGFITNYASQYWVSPDTWFSDMINDNNNIYLANSRNWNGIINIDYNGNILNTKQFSILNGKSRCMNYLSWYGGNILVYQNAIRMQNPPYLDKTDMYLYTLDKYLNVKNSMSPIDISYNYSSLEAPYNDALDKIVVNNNQIQIGKKIINPGGGVLPIIIRYNNNGNVDAKVYKTAGYDTYNSRGSFAVSLLNKNNTTYVAFNTHYYGYNNNNNSANQHIFMGTLENDVLKTCNYDNFQVNTTPITVRQEEVSCVSVPFTNYTLQNNYLQLGNLPTMQTQNFACTPCVSPELLLVPVRNIPYDFENLIYSPTTSQLLLSLKSMLGTDWNVGYTYSNTKSAFTNNTEITIYNNNFLTYNISNPIYNNKVWVLNLSYNNPLPKNICKLNATITEIGDYIFCFDFGSFNHYMSNIKVNPLLDCKIEIQLKKAGNTVPLITKLYNYYSPLHFIGGSAALVDLGFKDYCAVFPISSTGNYTVELILTWVAVPEMDHSNFAFDNFSLKKMCSTCVPYPGRMANPEIKDEEIKRITPNELTVYPNPTNTNINLKFRLETDAKANLYIMDYLGRNIATVINNEQLTQGQQNYNIDVSQYANGIYIAILEIDGKRSLQKFVVQH